MSKPVMRFNMRGNHFVNPEPNGMYVRYEDYAALEATLEATKRAALAGMDAATSASSIRLEEAARLRAESSPEALASERAANAILTEENERLREQMSAFVAAARNDALNDAAAALRDHNRARREWVPGSLWDTLSNEAAARIEALKVKRP